MNASFESNSETVSILHFAPLRLKKNEDHRLRAGHLWVYSNEVDTDITPLHDFEPGQPVQVEAHSGAPLGTGYVNPHSLICARLVSRDTAYPFSPSLIVHRLNVALSLRERLFNQPFYRWVFGEADGLPGLIIERFDSLCVVQITTAGMERMKNEIIRALHKTIKPTAVLWRNDSPIRALEELASYVEPAYGKIPPTIELTESSAQFQVPMLTGQKTGWFFDQRDNRKQMMNYVRGGRVLDVFSYIGGYGIQAALAGAREVICVDSSAPALTYIQENAQLNHVTDRITTQLGDAFEVLKQLREQRERFDLVIVDPPAFIKRKKDFAAGLSAYRRLNQMAMQLLDREGFLISCSCSQLLPRETLVNTLLQTARHLDRHIQILAHGYQAPDHPIHPAIPETEYLKVVFTRILPV